MKGHFKSVLVYEPALGTRFLEGAKEAIEYRKVHQVSGEDLLMKFNGRFIPVFNESTQEDLALIYNEGEMGKLRKENEELRRVISRGNKILGEINGLSDTSL